ncbi:F-box-like domain-containing protein 4 [Elsinoe fawcettii]|nr:F-box-like domain-containing protein 4 [Elsinoe fawcettii]
MKRSRDDDFLIQGSGTQKRTRFDSACADHLSGLSHELLLRILSSLSVSDLVTCHRISHYFRDLASDSQLWKAHYYNRFVRPRASRIPGIRDSGDSRQHLHFSSKISKWLDEEGLIKKGRNTNWKRQYKLRHNWSQGTCSVSEVAVSEQASIPPLLVQMRESTIFMADQSDGLRAWNSSSGAGMLAKVSLDHSEATSTNPPTALAVDASKTSEHSSQVTVGLQDGSFDIYELDHRTRVFRLQYRHPASSNGMLNAIALSYPYLATMTANQLLSVYKFPTDSAHTTLSSPTLVHSLHSHTSYPPLSLTIRPSVSKILISIAYALPTYLSGWTVGIQELHLSPINSSLMTSRLASAISTPSPSPFRQSNYSIFPFASPSSSTATFPQTPASTALSPTDAASATPITEIHTPPTSLSYCHPYLLVSHPDNTLTLYLVTSTDDHLSISPGKRLWGHTSSVSGTSIGLRGRAVSVSKRGDEVRVWDLEERIGRAQRRGAAGREAREGSVRVVPESPSRVAASPESARGSGSGVHKGESTVGARDGGKAESGDALAVDTSIGETVARWSEWYRGTEEEETSIARGWVGFDEENVVLLKERMGRGQSLVVYDFA